MNHLMHCGITLFIILVLTAPLAAREGGEPQAAPATLIPGDKAPHFVLKTLNPEICGQNMVSSKTMVGADAKDGTKVVVVSFLSVHCKPCLREMPELSAWYLKNRPAGVQVVAIDIDREAEEIEQVTTLATEKGVKFPVLSDRFNLLSRRYKVGELPYLLLIDATGTVKWVKTGFDDGVFAELDAAIAPYLSPAPEAK
jgi:peroxiredoxin